MGHQANPSPSNGPQGKTRYESHRALAFGIKFPGWLIRRNFRLRYGNDGKNRLNKEENERSKKDGYSHKSEVEG